MTNYEKGRALEYEIKKLFTDAGYTVVRAAGSHSPFDLVALKQGREKHKTVFFTVLAQCKVSQDPFPVEQV